MVAIHGQSRNVSIGQQRALRREHPVPASTLVQRVQTIFGKGIKHRVGGKNLPDGVDLYACPFTQPRGDPLLVELDFGNALVQAAHQKLAASEVKRLREGAPSQDTSKTPLIEFCDT